jgi:hypothetical protein
MYKCRCKLPNSDEECGAEYATWDSLLRHHNGVHGVKPRAAAHPGCNPLTCRLKEAKNGRPAAPDPSGSPVPLAGLARLNALMSVRAEDAAESSTLESWRTRQRMKPRLDELLLQLDPSRKSFFETVAYPAALDQIEIARCAAQPLFLFGPFP